MAKSTVLIAPDYTSDATFRACVSGISTALQALFTKVTQTGEINTATVTKPAAANTAQGFEVYRLNDALHATAPVFFKIEYGSSSTAATPTIWLTVGKGADGSGNITSVILARQQVVYLNSGSTNGYNCYFGNGDGSCLIMSLFPTSPGVGAPGSYVAVERSRDSNGNPTAVGVFWQYSGWSNSSDYCEAVDYNTAQKNTLTCGCINIPFNLDTNVSLSNGVSSPVFTGFVVTPERNSWVPTSILGACQVDFGIGTVAASLINAVDYLAIGAASQFSDVAKQQYASVLLRWD